MLRECSVFFGLVAFAGGCGSRTTLTTHRPGGLPEGTCIRDADCASEDRCTFALCRDGACQPAWVVDCSDGDACTKDRCEPTTGECEHEPVTPDLDGDGHRAPMPGMTAGQAGACGDDCNDADSDARPGAVEVCDGLDNDCNGIVDDRAMLMPTAIERRVSIDVDSASPEGLGYSRSRGAYLVSYSATVAELQLDAYYVASITPMGDPVSSSTRFTHVAASSYAGPLAWTGDRFGTLWADRRNANGSDDNYEIYFNEMLPDGTKLGPDVRMTQSIGFSVGPALVWTGTAFVAVWQDSGPSGNIANQLFAQRVGLGAEPVGVPVRLVDQGEEGQEAPVLANGLHTIGVAWMHGKAENRSIEFATFDPNLRLVGGPIQLSDKSRHGVGPSVVYGEKGYTIAWYDPDLEAGRPIYGAVVDEQARYVVKPRPITDSPRHSRYPSVLGYGDRVLLLWSDDKDANLGYEVYAKTLDLSLAPLSEEMRLTYAPGDSVGPVAAFGPSGDVGVVFRDDRESVPQVYFTRLACR